MWPKSCETFFYGHCVSSLDTDQVSESHVTELVEKCYAKVQFEMRCFVAARYVVFFKSYQADVFHCSEIEFRNKNNVNFVEYIFFVKSGFVKIQSNFYSVFYFFYVYFFENLFTQINTYWNIKIFLVVKTELIKISYSESKNITWNFLTSIEFYKFKTLPQILTKFIF